MNRIRALKANVTREQAVEQFSSRGLFRIFRNQAFGRLRSVAEFYVPFRIFRTRIENRGAMNENLVALDVVTGTLDLFKFDRLPGNSETDLSRNQELCPGGTRKRPRGRTCDRPVTPSSIQPGILPGKQPRHYRDSSRRRTLHSLLAGLSRLRGKRARGCDRRRPPEVRRRKGSPPGRAMADFETIVKMTAAARSSEAAPVALSEYFRNSKSP